MTNELQLAWHFPDLIVLYLHESYKKYLESSHKQVFIGLHKTKCKIG